MTTAVKEGSARHNYHKSDWYVRAKRGHKSFWSAPYYYYDGTNISGHYTTFVKPVYTADGRLACVCGADMTFEWMSAELTRFDNQLRNNELLNKYFVLDDFYTMVINDDGSRIAGPDDKAVTLSEAVSANKITLHRSGVVDMTVNGVPSTVYYVPINRVDWSVALVVAHQDVQPVMLTLSLVLGTVMLLGLFIVWLVCRRIKYAEAA